MEESKVALVYGQMNAPPGARMRVGLTALTMAEYFRDVNERCAYQHQCRTFLLVSLYH